MIDSTHFKSEQPHPTIQHRFLQFHKPFLWGQLGSLVTIFVLLMTARRHSIDSPLVPYLFIFILCYPLTVSYLLLASDSWKRLPLQERYPIIQLGFWTSWLAVFMIPAAHLITGSDFVSFIFLSSLLTAGLGYLLLKATWKLQQELRDESDLFP